MSVFALTGAAWNDGFIGVTALGLIGSAHCAARLAAPFVSLPFSQMPLARCHVH